MEKENNWKNPKFWIEFSNEDFIYSLVCDVRVMCVRVADSDISKFYLCFIWNKKNLMALFENIMWNRPQKMAINHITYFIYYTFARAFVTV